MAAAQQENTLSKQMQTPSDGQITTQIKNQL
jgi:hypothetical protein